MTSLGTGCFQRCLLADRRRKTHLAFGDLKSQGISYPFPSLHQRFLAGYGLSGVGVGLWNPDSIRQSLSQRPRDPFLEPQLMLL